MVTGLWQVVEARLESPVFIFILMGLFGVGLVFAAWLEGRRSAGIRDALRESQSSRADRPRPGSDDTD